MKDKKVTCQILDLLKSFTRAGKNYTVKNLEILPIYILKSNPGVLKKEKQHTNIRKIQWYNCSAMHQPI